MGPWELGREGECFMGSLLSRGGVMAPGKVQSGEAGPQTRTTWMRLNGLLVCASDRLVCPLRQGLLTENVVDVSKDEAALRVGGTEVSCLEGGFDSVALRCLVPIGSEVPSESSPQDGVVRHACDGRVFESHTSAA